MRAHRVAHVACVADGRRQRTVPAGPRSTAPGGSVSVPIRRQGGTFTVPAEVNERVILRFIVDSGASVDNANDTLVLE